MFRNEEILLNNSGVNKNTEMNILKYVKLNNNENSGYYNLHVETVLRGNV